MEIFESDVKKMKISVDTPSTQVYNDIKQSNNGSEIVKFITAKNNGSNRFHQGG